MKYNGFYEQFGFTDLPASGCASFTAYLVFTGVGDAVRDHVKAISGEIRSFSAFKNLDVRQLIWLIGDDLFWDDYERRYIYHFDFINKNQKSVNSQDESDGQFSNDIDLSHGSSTEIRSILIRLVCILMGINPYKDLKEKDLQEVQLRIHFEISKVLREFRLLNNLQVYRSGWWLASPLDPPQQWNILPVNPFENILNAKSLIDPMCLIFTHAMGDDAFERRGPHVEPYFIRSKISGGISEDDLIKIWGRSKKAFKNEIYSRKEDEMKKEIIKYFNFEEYGDPVSLITMSSALEWLDTKRINYDFFSQEKNTDYNYKDLKDIFYKSNLENKEPDQEIDDYLRTIEGLDLLHS